MRFVLVIPVVAVLATLALLSAPVELEPESTIRLVAGGAIRGTVRDPDGRAVSGATVRASHGVGYALRSPFAEDLPGGQYEFWFDAETVTDSLGRYRLDGLGLGESYGVTASSKGWEKAAADLVFVERVRPSPSPPSKAKTERPPSRTPRYGDALLAGTVVDERGVPVKYGNVGLPGVSRHARTDGQGRFRIDKVPSGPVEIIVGSEHHDGVRREIVAPSKNLRFRLIRRKGVWVTIRLPVGARSIPRGVDRTCGGWSTTYTWRAEDRVRELVCRANPGQGAFRLRVVAIDVEGHHRPRFVAALLREDEGLRWDWTDSAGCAEWLVPPGSYRVIIRDYAGDSMNVGDITVRLEPGQDPVRLVVPVRDAR